MAFLGMKIFDDCFKSKVTKSNLMGNFYICYGYMYDSEYLSSLNRNSVVLLEKKNIYFSSYTLSKCPLIVKFLKTVKLAFV